MQITVQLPDDFAQHPDPAGEALEALAIEGYRSGKLSQSDAGRLLGLCRIEFEGFLKRHGILEGSYSSEDLQNDVETLERLLGEGNQRK
jgi:predicted HTH domain antitoxin